MRTCSLPVQTALSWLSLDPGLTALEANTRQLAAEAVASGKAVYGDLFVSSKPKKPRIDVAATILDDDGRPAAVLVLRIDPEQFLYPLIQSWPTPSQTAETLLIRKDNEDVLFLNQLRHRPDAALSLRIPMSSGDVPAVRAALGETGQYEGPDYRGVQVLADIRPVPDSPWFMVAKVDCSEILAEARYRGGVVLLFVVLAILITGGTAAFFLICRQRSLYEQLHRAERRRREAQEEIRTTLYSIGDAVIATDAAGLVVRMNPVAEQLTGWREADAAGQSLEQVFRIINEESRAEVENPAARVIREGTVVGLANHTVLIARDGAERPIADSGAPIRNEEGQIAGVVLVFRDQIKDRAAQKALAASETRYRRLFEAAQDGIMILDAGNGRIVDVNPFLLDLLGYAHEELLGKELWQVGLFQDIAAAQRAFRELQEQGYIRYEDLPLKTVDGRRVEVEFVSNVYLVNDAKVIQCNIRDISDRKRAERALHESREIYRATLYGIGDAVIATDAESRVRQMNPVAEAAHRPARGRRRRPAPGAGVRYYQRTDPGPGREPRRAGDSRGNRRGARQPYGPHRPRRDRAAHRRQRRPIRNEAGQITGVVLVFRDQTEHRRAERALRDSEQRYRSLFDNMLEGFAYCQMLFEGNEPQDFIYLDVNAAFKRLTGLNDVVGKRVSEVIPGIREAHRELFECYGRVARTGRPEKFEIFLQELDAWLSVAVYSAERDRFVAVFDNITGRKRAEEDLQESQRKQAEAEKLAATGRMAAQVAHEINNPLAGIKNSFRLIRDAVPKDHPDIDMVERIEREIDRIAHIVRQMYQVYSPQAQQPRNVSVCETIRDMMVMLEPLCREHDVAIELGPIPPEVTVWAPESSLQQILYNLTINAIQASPPKGKVNIFVSNADKEGVEISIHDRGHGMSPEIRERVFEPFFSTSSADSGDSTKKGLGLGLSIVKTIVSSLGGTIDFQSTVGEGTCFHVYLPSKQPQGVS